MIITKKTLDSFRALIALGNDVLNRERQRVEDFEDKEQIEFLSRLAGIQDSLNAVEDGIDFLEKCFGNEAA